MMNGPKKTTVGELAREAIGWLIENVLGRKAPDGWRYSPSRAFVESYRQAERESREREREGANDG